jgi:copper chaperone CopZ
VLRAAEGGRGLTIRTRRKPRQANEAAARRPVAALRPNEEHGPADPHNLHDTADKPVWERIDIATEGNDCDECVRALRESLMKIKGVREVIADPKSENVWVTFDARKTHPPDLHDAILRSGYKPASTAD